MVWLKNYQNNIYTTSSLAATLGQVILARKLQSSCTTRTCSDHFEDSQYMDPAHTSLMPHTISIDFI